MYKILLPLCTLLSFPISAHADVLISENFEDQVLSRGMSITSVGTFSAGPGIQAFTQMGGNYAYSAGRSTNSANSFDNFTSTLSITFAAPTYVETLSFDEMEIGNWGSLGFVRIDGQPDGPYASEISNFSRFPYNDGISDATYRSHMFNIFDFVTVLDLFVWDITSQSEVFIDNVVVTGTSAVSPVPEPATLTMCGICGLAMAGASWGKHRRMRITTSFCGIKSR